MQPSFEREREREREREGKREGGREGERYYLVSTEAANLARCMSHMADLQIAARQ